MANIALLKPLNRKLFFSSQVDQETISELSKKIIEINTNDRELEQYYPIYGLKYDPQPIEIYIDSYGGKVYQIMGLISIIEQSKTPIHTICTGCAMSCGFLLLINGHKRYCYEHGTPLYHQVSSGGNGKVEDLEQKLIETKRLQEKIEEMTMKKTKITKEMLNKNRIEKVDWYMDAVEAKKLGVVDEII